MDKQKIKSLTELQSHLLIARDLGYITKDEFALIAEQTVKVNKLVSGLIKSSQDHTLYMIHNT